MVGAQSETDHCLLPLSNSDSLGVFWDVVFDVGPTRVDQWEGLTLSHSYPLFSSKNSAFFKFIYPLYNILSL